MRPKAMRVMSVLMIVAIIAASLTSAVTSTRSQESNVANPLNGTSWQLVKFKGPDERTFSPDDKSKYTISFGRNGRVTVRVDCNRGSSTWRVTGKDELEFGSWSRTNAKCGAGSLHDQIVTEGADVHKFNIENGHLFLFGMPRGGYYELEPMPAKR